MRLSKPEATKNRIPFGAAIYGTVTETVSQGRRAILIHGDGGPFASIFVKRGAFESVLPSAKILGIPAGPVFVAWDGVNYEIRQSLREIQADDNLTLVGSLGGSETEPVLPSNSVTPPAPNSVQQISSPRIGCSVYSPAAVRRINAFIDKSGFSLTEFANLVNTTDRTMRKIRRTAKIKRTQLDDIARVLGISRAELINESQS
jgi:hypothetical protein